MKYPAIKFGNFIIQVNNTERESPRSWETTIISNFPNAVTFEHTSYGANLSESKLRLIRDLKQLRRNIGTLMIDLARHGLVKGGDELDE